MRGDASDAAPVHERIDAHAWRAPRAVAVRCGDAAFTYAELIARADALAAALRARGVRPEVPVGVCLERSLHVPVALLAVLKAGGCYLPLDPGSPTPRLAFVLEDARAPVLVTQASMRERLPAARSAVVLVDRDHAGGPDAAALPPARPDHLAYVIYTSGSTGSPKGVMVEHRHLAATLEASARLFGFGPDDVLPVLASPMFDISLFELLLPLVCGGTALMLDRAQMASVGRIARAVRGATALHAVPALMQRIAETVEAMPPAERPAPTRAVFTGGDAVPPDLLEQLCRIWPETPTYVLYGPTEATIICAARRVWPGAIPRRYLIGTAMPHAELRVLDERGHPVAPGEAGELCVGGAGVARGYLNRRELTAARFATDASGTRLYRTGDLARRLEDGTLEFLGRIDTQVKIRGYRVELGEIETALRQHPEIRDAAVVVRDDAAGRRLVAYAVPAREALPANLLEALGAWLPAYMVPAEIVPLRALPLTPNGKIDRRALAAGLPATPAGPA